MHTSVRNRVWTGQVWTCLVWMGLVAAAFAVLSTPIGSTALAFQPAQPSSEKQPAKTPNKPSKAEAESWVKQVNEGMKTGCSVIKTAGATATLTALKTKNPQVAQWAAILTAAGAACDEVTKLIDGIVAKGDEKAKQKAAADAEAKLEELMKQVKLLDNIKERTKQIGELDHGVVDVTRKDFASSADDVVKDKAAAIKRWKALAAALKTNIERLNERNDYLLKVVAQCDALTKKLEALKRKVEGFERNDAGVCDTIECLQNLKLQEILVELPKLKKAAEAKQKEVEKTLKDEKTRRENLKRNLETLFQEKVD